MADKFEEEPRQPFLVCNPTTPLPLPGTTENLYGPTLNLDTLRSDLANTPLLSESLPEPIANKTILIKDGLVTAGGLDFYADAGNGLYRIGSDNYAHSTNGQKRLELFNTGVEIDGKLNIRTVADDNGSLELFFDSTLSRVQSLSEPLVVGGTTLSLRTGDTERLGIGTDGESIFSAWVQIGTATDAATAGDLAAGLTGASRLFFDQSDQALLVYDSSGNEDLRLDMNADSYYKGSGRFGFGGAPTGWGTVEILNSVGNHLVLVNTGGGGQVNFQCSGGGNLLVTPFTGVINMTTSSDTPGGPILLNMTNEDTDGGHSQIELNVEHASVGDPKLILWANSSGSVWSLGMDNTDKYFKIAMDDDLGTANDRIIMTSLGLSQKFANGQQFTEGSLTELTTIAAAATTDTAIQIPANAVVFAVSVRVTVVIPTAATFTVTGTTSATQFDVAGGVAVAANTTDVGTRNAPYKNGAAQTIRITPDVPPAANTGRVRVTIHYYEITPATS